MKKINVSFVGATSITSSVAIKILMKNPEVEFVHLISETQAGKKTSEVFPELKNVIEKPLEEYNPGKLISDSDCIFLFKQHGKAIEKTRDLIEKIKKSGKKVKIIDMSADFRLKNPALYEKYYGVLHPFPEFLCEAVYGLPEIYAGEIKKAGFIANPGCYPTSVILGLFPLLSKKNIKSGSTIIIESYSGVSGAGRIPSEKNIAVNILENLVPYKFNSHQHLPEIKQEAEVISGNKFEISFSPHIIPVINGIFTTCYIDLDKEIPAEELTDIYKKCYEKNIFIRILAQGIYPEIKNVNGTNFCDISINTVSPKKIAVMSALDNVIKGASGQAVQNFNLIFGLNETTGLI